MKRLAIALTALLLMIVALHIVGVITIPSVGDSVNTEVPVDTEVPEELVDEDESLPEMVNGELVDNGVNDTLDNTTIGNHTNTTIDNTTNTTIYGGPDIGSML